MRKLKKAPVSSVVDEWNLTLLDQYILIKTLKKHYEKNNIISFIDNLYSL